MKTYKLIYADPGWKYNDKCNSGKRGSIHKYTVSAIEELIRLDIPSISDKDCLLAMWHVAPMPKEAIRLAEAWGFTVKTMKGFTWHKTTKHGKSHFGMGHYTRSNTEDCLFAVKGRPIRISASVPQFISSPIREHSRKPDEIRDRLVNLLGDVPRIELFARQVVAGWDVWGDQIESSIEMPVHFPSMLVTFKNPAYC